MVFIKPFRALRPSAENAKRVACVPYDVIYESEVREYLAKNPLSFLRVTRPEADFPEGSGPTPQEVFARGRENLERFITDQILTPDPDDDIYVYQLASDGHSQTGVVACCSIEEYEQGMIRKHENVRPDKVEERTAHLLAVGAQTGLIFLAFRGTPEIHDLIDTTVTTEPIYDFECPAGTQQRVWRVTETAAWISAFSRVPSLYIADGHHRAESAKLARDEMRHNNPHHTGEEQYNFVVTGMFPAEDLRILPYNRVVKDLNDMADDEFLTRLQESFVLIGTGEKEPQNHGEFCLYLAGKWYSFRHNLQYIREPDPIERLDVSILQDNVFGPLLDIKDARTDDRIGFVGGRRGTAELERLVNEGIAAAAFSMYPTTMDDLLAVSDMGEIMPPKSTWFEPKLKDGLLIHLI
ncbi:MAG: DUF1015 domain-containing protein [Chloracidobacterium sp.]|nr:DUF1015 domain-containing protein [Chloracidobacterium sp.]